MKNDHVNVVLSVAIHVSSYYSSVVYCVVQIHASFLVTCVFVCVCVRFPLLTDCTGETLKECLISKSSRS